MFDRAEFESRKLENAAAQAADESLQAAAHSLLTQAFAHDYAHQWTWLGLPIIQLPQDIMVLQEIVWRTRPEVIIETGIAWGGQTVFLASLLQLLGQGQVIAIDTVLPEGNRRKILDYPFGHRIRLIEGSSGDPEVVAQARAAVPEGASVMVILDSNHTEAHVLNELRLLGPLVTPGQYLVVGDTIVEEMAEAPHRDRPWGKGNNPATALKTWLEENDAFEADPYVNAKGLLTFHPGGYLRRIR